MKTIEYLLIKEVNNYIEYISNIKYAKSEDEIEHFTQNALNQVRNKFKLDIQLFKSHLIQQSKDVSLQQNKDVSLQLIKVYFSFKDELLYPYTFYYIPAMEL